MFVELVRLAVGNLLRARARLAMTAGGVLVGTTAVILLIALTIGLQNAAEASIGASGSLTELQVYPNFSGDFSGNVRSVEEIPQLNLDAVRALWQIEGVAAVIPMASLYNLQLKSGDYFGWGQVFGVDPAAFPYLGVQLQSGQPTIGTNQAVIGGRVGEQFYDPENTDEFVPIVLDLSVEPVSMVIYQSTGTSFSEREHDLQINGVLPPGTNYDGAVFLPMQDVIRYKEWSEGIEYDPDTFVYDQIIVRTVDREATAAVSEAIRDLGYMPAGLGELLNQLNSFFTTMRIMLGGVGGVALLVAAFGVANTMTMAILERTKEIGLMKAIGATDRDVLTVFLIEAALVGLCGGAAGVGAALLLRNAINGAIEQTVQNGGGQQGGGGMMFFAFDPSQLQGGLVIIPTELMLFALTLATAVGVSAGLYPAWRAARLPPVIALKTE